MSVTLSTETKRFFANLEKELAGAKLTPAQAEQLRKAASVLEGGAGITNDNIEKVGKELKLTPSQKSALRFAFLLDRVKHLVGGDLTAVASSSARALRHIVKQAAESPKLAAGLNTFFTSFARPTAEGVNIEERVAAKHLERRDGALWLAASPPRMSWKSVTMETADKRFKLRADNDGQIEVGKKHGSSTRWMPLSDITYDSANSIKELLDELTPADRQQREFVNKFQAQMPTSGTHGVYGFERNYGGTNIGTAKGKIRAVTPKIKNADVNDPGALKKTPEGWRFHAAKDGKLQPQGVPLDKLSLEALLRLKSLIETHTSAATLQDLANGMDIDVDDDASELDTLLGGLAMSRINSRRALYKAAEQRLRDALQGMPVGKIEREVFLQLVGATTPGGP
jgi:hypothetical protein